MPRLYLPDRRQGAILNQDYVIDWQNPLTYKLLFAAYCGGQDRVEMVGQTTGTLLSSGSWGGNTPGGNAVESTSETTGGVYWPHNGILKSIVRNYTIIVNASIDVSSTTYCTLLGVPYGSTWVNPYGTLVFYRYNSTGRCAHIFTYSSSGYRSTSAPSSTTYWGSGLHGYCMTRSGVTVGFYKDGIFSENATITDGDVYWPSTNRSVALFNHSPTNPGEGTDGRVLGGFIWGRTLSAAEIALFYGDPRGILKPRKKKVFSLPIANVDIGATYVRSNFNRSLGKFHMVQVD